MRDKISTGITLATTLVILFAVLALSISSIFDDMYAAPVQSVVLEKEGTIGIVRPPASATGSLPTTDTTIANEVAPKVESVLKPLTNWPEDLKPLENYSLKVEYAMEDSYRWDLEIQGNINIITGAIVTDMRKQGWDVEILYSYLGIEILGTYGEAKMSLFVDTLLTDESNWSQMTVLYQKAPIPYLAPTTTVPYEPSSKS